jgi:hypothetical protein
MYLYVLVQSASLEHFLTFFADKRWDQNKKAYAHISFWSNLFLKGCFFKKVVYMYTLANSLIKNYILYNYVMIPILYNLGGLVVHKILVHTLPSPVSSVLCLT